MTKLTRTIALTAASLIAVGGLTACSTGTSTPTATTTVTATPEAVAPLDRTAPDSIEQAAMQDAWDTFSYSDQSLMCDYYLAYPDEAFGDFNEGAGGVFSQSEFNAFFDSHCDSGYGV